MQEHHVRAEQGSGVEFGGAGAGAMPGAVAGQTGGKRPLAAYVIIEKKGFDKPFWNRIGSAFTNRDGSINVYLDSLPIQGKIHLREDTPKEEREARGDARKKPASSDPFGDGS